MNPKQRASLVFASLLWLWAAPADALKCPNLQLVVDRSGSMDIPIGAQTRWQVARAALQSLLTTYGGRVPVGLSLFPRGSSCDVEDPLPPGLGTRSRIIAALDAKGPDGGTPTPDVINRTARLAELRDPARKQYMILVTDGLPECEGLDPRSAVDVSADALRAAAQQSPPIYTFVVGFGSAGDPDLQSGLTRMAEAGGRPAPTPQKFYPAEDEAGLDLAIQQILESVMDEFGGRVCDESCEVQGCPDGGVCLRHECVRNPCEGFDCGADGFCYTDGTSPGVCRKACLATCPAGTRCSMGNCSPDPCGNVCLPGTFCNGATRRCEPDPQCKAPMAPTCEAPADCVGGRCALDPCLFVRCPPGTACTAWDGSCAATADTIGQAGRMDRGCAALPGAPPLYGPGGMVLLALGLLGLGLRRRA